MCKRTSAAHIDSYPHHLPDVLSGHAEARARKPSRRLHISTDHGIGIRSFDHEIPGDFGDGNLLACDPDSLLVAREMGGARRELRPVAPREAIGRSHRLSRILDCGVVGPAELGQHIQ
jgi:hypothetical protein